MAENKKGFILYADLLKVVELMPDEVAGKLFKIILQYVNDIEVEINDLLLKISFEPIKQQLKRDLVKYEDKRTKNKESANKRWQKEDANACERIKVDANYAVTVIDNVNDTVTDTVIKKEKEKEAIASPPKKNILERSEDFGKNLEFYKNEYSRELLRDFYNYWKEPNQTKTKMRFELEKTWDLNLRLKRWAKGDDKFGNKTAPPQPETPRYNIYEQVKKYG